MEQKHIKRGGFYVFLLGTMAYMFSYIGRMNYSACLNSMVGDGLFTTEFGGYISTAYMIVYGSGQMINGVFGRRFPSKYMVFFGLFGAGVMNVLMGLVGNRFAVMAVWAFNGLFMSMLWAPIIKAFAEWIEEKDRKKYAVRLSVSIPCGTIVSYLIPAIYLDRSSWHTVFFICGGCLFFASIVWIVGTTLIGKYIKFMTTEFKKRQSEALETVSEGKKVTLGGLIFGCALFVVVCGVLFNGSLKDALANWVPTYVVNTFGLSDSYSAGISVIIPMITIFGTFIASKIDRKFFDNEIYTSAVMFATATIAIVPIIFTANIKGELGGLITTLLIAIAISAMWGANTMFLSMVPYRFADIGMASAVTGFLNCFAYFSAAASSSVYGIVAENSGWNNVVLLWVAMGIGGTALCALGGKLWKRKLVQNSLA